MPKTAWLEVSPSLARFLAARQKTMARKRAYMKAYNSATYALMKSLGICTRCHREAAMPGYTVCMACNLYNNQTRSGSAGRGLRKRRTP